jgi:hypothetical protein
LTVSVATLRTREHDITDCPSSAMMRRDWQGVLILHRWALAHLASPDVSHGSSGVFAAIAAIRDRDHG